MGGELGEFDLVRGSHLNLERGGEFASLIITKIVTWLIVFILVILQSRYQEKLKIVPLTNYN